MRWLGCLLLVGCYSPAQVGECAISCASSSECPGELVCTSDKLCGVSMEACTGVPNDALDSDAADGQDGSSSACLVGGAAPTTLDAIIGFFYTTNGTIAIYEAIPDLLITSFNVNVKGEKVMLLDPDLTRSHVRPRLDSGSDDLYMLATNNGGTCSLIRFTRVLGENSWNQPVVLTTNLGSSLCAVVPGSPTTTNPRRMLVSNGPTTILEGVDQGSDAWLFTTLPVPPTFDEYEQPALSSDGLHMLFRGRTTVTNTIGLYIASRDQPGQPFDSPTLFADQPGGGSGVETTPSFAPDCQSTYVSLDSPNRVVLLQ